ncbi:MAG: transporter substrate-binding domain-containing protein [Psychromonas sp.]
MFYSRIFLFLFLLMTSSATFAVPTLDDESLSIKFATEANYFPFEYLDEQKQIKGFDIDIANAICNAVNLTCSFHHQSFDSLLLTLQFGRFDAVIAALDITEERLQQVDFSESYYKNTSVFVSRNSAFEKFTIKDKFIGIQANSSNQAYLIKYAKEDSFIIPYPSFSDAFDDLAKDRIDVVFADQAIVNDFLEKDDNEEHFSIHKEPENIFTAPFSEGYGIAIQKGNVVLQQRLNSGLKIIIENGSYQEIYNRYF